MSIAYTYIVEIITAMIQDGARRQEEVLLAVEELHQAKYAAAEATSSDALDPRNPLGRCCEITVKLLSPELSLMPFCVT